MSEPFRPGLRVAVVGGGWAGLAAAVESYARVYGRELSPVHRASSKLRQLLGLPRIVRSGLLGMVEHSAFLRRKMVEATR